MENKDERIILASRAISRAESGLHFLNRCLDLIHRRGTDAVFSRSLYILFSYNFELIIKAYVLLNSVKHERKELLKEIKTHDLVKLINKLPQNKLECIGIRKISKQKNLGFSEYIVEQINGNTLILQDFIDVRYDFGKDVLREIDNNESKEMKKEVSVFLDMIKKITDNEIQLYYRVVK